MATLELKKYDLYGNGVVENYPNGEQYLIREKIEYSGNEDDSFHVVKETDTLTYIAWLYYKDVVENPSKYWWVIADANNIEFPLDLSSWIGSEIMIPSLTKFLINQ